MGKSMVTTENGLCCLLVALLFRRLGSNAKRARCSVDDPSGNFGHWHIVTPECSPRAAAAVTRSSDRSPQATSTRPTAFWSRLCAHQCLVVDARRLHRNRRRSPGSSIRYPDRQQFHWRFWPTHGIRNQAGLGRDHTAGTRRICP
jgi:hypothetical protein